MKQLQLFLRKIIDMPVSKIKPPPLKPRDEVVIVSPAFAIDESAVEKSVLILESWGLKVRVGRNALKKDGPFAGTDRQRLADMQKAT
ncbi:MAG: LD-carboxypeptidase, partial [Bacteroidales bacterium]|nr:LD-carboxypeptidase [Bacteroidales bacterium]MBN2632756.1 LD-carboxypeptidase [Bacteroidales bacterium]